MFDINTLVPMKEDEEIIFDDHVYNIPVDMICATDVLNHSRGAITGQECALLMSSLQSEGQHTPGIVRLCDEEERVKYGAKFALVAGFRRFFAIKNLLCWPTYRATIKHEMSQEAARILNWSENQNRSDLNLMQKARYFEWFIKRGWTEQRIIDAHPGLNRGYIQPLCMLLKMSPLIQEMAAQGYLKATDVRKLNSFVDSREREEAATKFKRQKDCGITKPFIKLSEKTKRDRRTLKAKHSPKQIQDLLKYMYMKNIPYSLWGRMAAWCGGQISDLEFSEDVQEFCDHPGHNTELLDYLLTINEHSNPEEVGKKIINFCVQHEKIQFDLPPTGFPEYGH